MNDWEIKLLFFQTLTQKMKIKESGIFLTDSRHWLQKNKKHFLFFVFVKPI